MAPLFAILLALILQVPASYSGTLFDPTGGALPDVPVSVTDTASGEKFETRTDGSGRFAFSSLPPGRYRIDISKPGFRQTAGPLTLADGQRLIADVTAQLAGIAHSYRVLPNADPAKAQRTVVRAAPPDDPCKGITAAGCVTPPIRMVEAFPVYPPALAEQGVRADVEVTGILGTDGRLKDLKVAEGVRAEFAAAALAALRHWEYSPMRVNGIAQETSFTVTFRFAMATN